MTPSPDAFPEPRRVNVGAVDLAVYEMGPETGPPVILIHGWPELARSWSLQLPALAAAGYRAIAFDLRGYGASDGPAEVDAYRVDVIARDFTGLLDALGYDRAVFVGHDWGGLLMWPFAQLHPDRVAGLIGVNTPHLPPSGRDPIEVFREQGGERHYVVVMQTPGLAEAMVEGREETFFTFVFGAFPPREKTRAMGPRAYQLFDNFAAFTPDKAGRCVVPAEHRAHYVEAYRRTGFTRPMHLYRNITANAALMREVDPVIRAPSLMISTEDDFMLPPEAARFMETLNPDLEQHVIPGVGHWTQWEAPEALNVLMLDWLERRYPA